MYGSACIKLFVIFHCCNSMCWFYVCVVNPAWVFLRIKFSTFTQYVVNSRYLWSNDWGILLMFFFLIALPTHNMTIICFFSKTLPLNLSKELNLLFIETTLFLNSHFISIQSYKIIALLQQGKRDVGLGTTAGSI